MDSHQLGDRVLECRDAIQSQIAADLQQDAQDNHEMAILMRQIQSPFAVNHEAMCASLLGVVLAKKRRREETITRVSKMHRELLELYTAYRGGKCAIECIDVPPVKFDVNVFGGKECELYFRFRVHELMRIKGALRIPDVIITSQHDRCDGFEVLCMLCMNYAYPRRRFEMMKIFGTSTPRISRLVSHLREDLYEKFYPRMSSPKLLTPDEIANYARVIYEKCEVPGIFSFIDGTVRPTPKPELFQNAVYNGKDRTHALKFQMLCTPDGIMRHISGPYCGSRHDQHMVHKSDVLDGWILKHTPAPDGSVYCTYADAGYAVTRGLMRPFPDEKVNIQHAAFNQVMASVRICVEWEFGDIVVYWAAVNYKPAMKIESGCKPGQQYIVAALLSNIHNCLRPGKTSRYFNCSPPTLEEYIASLTD